ncbi:pentatricopeptide repeat-containing protein At4g01030, mitochondrial-like [Aristolochia californica]|uniref:pentatricopeptide repeat-containing protein At4g01030, mitochondrial-like n=1 Tax=Aristolochia californica TaxID=171875 RepID=UPI0035D69B17
MVLSAILYIGANSMNFWLGAEIYACIIKNGFDLYADLDIALKEFYENNCGLYEAEQLFTEMAWRTAPSWNEAIMSSSENGCGFLSGSWDLYDKMEQSEAKPDLVTTTRNSMIRGHSIHGSLEEIVKVLHRMQTAGFKTNSSSITSAIQVITEMSPLELGKEIHCYTMRNGFDDDIYIGTSLVVMLCLKWISLKTPKLLSEMEQEDTWNNLILEHAILGLNKQALSLIHHHDTEARIKPNSSTMASLLQACVGLAFLEKGLELHCFVLKHSFYSDVYVTTALIAMYFKSGEEAISVFSEMGRSGLKPDATTFAELLSGCMCSGLIGEGWKHFDSMKSEYSMVHLIGHNGYLDEAWNLI